MNLHLHIANVNITVKDDKHLAMITDILTTHTHQLKKITTMGQETLQELKALAEETTTRLDNIAGDITRILDNQVPAEGGLSAEEVADLRSTLTALRDKAKGLDEQNEPTAAPPTEG